VAGLAAVFGLIKFSAADSAIVTEISSVQFDTEASQKRDYWVVKSATLRAAHQVFAAQRTLAQDDNQTAPLPRNPKACTSLFVRYTEKRNLTRSLGDHRLQSRAQSPANVEAERSILGAILLDNFAYNQPRKA